MSTNHLSMVSPCLTKPLAYPNYLSIWRRRCKRSIHHSRDQFGVTVEEQERKSDTQQESRVDIDYDLAIVLIANIDSPVSSSGRNAVAAVFHRDHPVRHKRPLKTERSAASCRSVRCKEKAIDKSASTGLLPASALGRCNDLICRTVISHGKGQVRLKEKKQWRPQLAT